MSKILQKIRDTLVREYQPDKIILFGSRAWGKPRKDSDYDLFIVKKGVKKRIHRRTGDVIRVLIRSDIWTPIDALVYNQREINKSRMSGSQFFNKVLNKGKILYER
ncbi:MAG: nucleotidyltransferase domain-containing protein [bacterium]|nr:nucleotidyltransferase domain-containing protein [bacterium]